jgi:hypothetical protein
MDSEQYESKLILSEVPFGSHQRIAEDIGQSAGAVSRKFNLNDELRNEIGGARRLLRSLKAHAPKQHQQALDFLNADDEEADSGDTGALVGSLTKETSDVVVGEVNIRRKPSIIDRFRDGLEAEAAAKAYNNHLRKQLPLRKVG